MSGASPGLLSAVVVAYNGGHALMDCLASLRAQTVPVELIVVDNASTDGSMERVQEVHPEVRVLRHEANRGYGAGANTGWRAATSEVVAILNQDLVLNRECLERMLEALLASSRKVLVTPKLLLKSDPTRVNAIGNEVHLSGVAWCHGLGTPRGRWHGTVEVTAISGAAFMTRTSFLHELSGLEEAYFMYMEDVDLSLRARLAGAVCLAACDAVAIHDWELSLSPDRFEMMERNRRALWRRFWAGQRRMYPVLLQAELMAWLYAISHGSPHVRAKLRAARSSLRLTTCSQSPSSSLLSILARRHPYSMLFPRLPMIAHLGRTADKMFAAAVPTPRT